MEDFVPYELAVKLKEKGFDVPMDRYYHIYDDVIEAQNSLEITGTDVADFFNSLNQYRCAAPTISQVLKWLREEKKIHFEFVAAAYGYNVIISQTPEAGGTDYYYTHMNDDGPNNGGAWDRYEDAALYCIEYVMDNLI